MELKGKTQVTVRPDLLFMLAAALLLLPWKWLLGWILSVAIHELGHIGATRLIGVDIYEISLRGSGACIRTEPMSACKEMLCAAAGPLCGLAALLFAPVFPQLAICAAIQTLFNLLPVLPMDGGRVAQCVFRICRAERLGHRINRILTVFLAGAVFLLAVLVFVRSHSILPVIFLLPVIIKAAELNLPCKPARERVQ